MAFGLYDFLAACPSLYPKLDQLPCFVYYIGSSRNGQLPTLLHDLVEEEEMKQFWP